MNHDYKTSVVEPAQQSTDVIDEASEEKLATQALEDIRNTERLSGFGRFATKMHDFFQAPKESQARQQASNLKAAPIMMSIGLLLLLGLLYPHVVPPNITVHEAASPAGSGSWRRPAR